MPAEEIRLDIRREYEEINGITETRWRWVIQSTGPVTDLVQGPATQKSEIAALRDFQAVCATLGWKNDIVDVLA